MKTAQKLTAQFSLLLVLGSGALFLAGCETPSGGGSAGTNNIEALTAAANGGDAEAALQLGDIYQHGRGVPKDHVESVRWHTKAAELFQKK
ncbi:MAG: SEL1-like repeat protein [Verrucomicrobia bacterium]|nr:SEL1-like repeat protein [Verrucomicrobiota bacterium]